MKFTQKSLLILVAGLSIAGLVMADKITSQKYQQTKKALVKLLAGTPTQANVAAIDTNFNMLNTAILQDPKTSSHRKTEVKGLKKQVEDYKTALASRAQRSPGSSGAQMNQANDVSDLINEMQRKTDMLAELVTDAQDSFNTKAIDDAQQSIDAANDLVAQHNEDIQQLSPTTAMLVMKHPQWNAIASKLDKIEQRIRDIQIQLASANPTLVGSAGAAAAAAGSPGSTVIGTRTGNQIDTKHRVAGEPEPAAPVMPQASEPSAPVITSMAQEPEQAAPLAIGKMDAEEVEALRRAIVDMLAYAAETRDISTDKSIIHNQIDKFISKTEYVLNILRDQVLSDELNGIKKWIANKLSWTEWINSSSSTTENQWSKVKEFMKKVRTSAQQLVNENA